MYLIIVGSDALGAKLVELALRDGHDVVLIEADAERARAAADAYDCVVLHADVAQSGILEEARVERADALLATTEDDAANLMAMFLGLDHGVKVLISVVNAASHRALFARLGVHVLVDPEEIIAQYLYGALSQPSVQEVVPLPGGAEVFEIDLDEGSPLPGRALSEIGGEGLLPKDTLIVSVRRGGHTLVPSGATQLEVGDHLTVFSQQPLSDGQLAALTGKRP